MRQGLIDAAWILTVVGAWWTWAENLGARFDNARDVAHNGSMTNRHSAPSTCQEQGCTDPVDFCVGFWDPDERRGVNVWLCRRHADEAVESGEAEGMVSA